MPATEQIRIRNPIDGGSRLTSRQRAERFVRRGEAFWSGKRAITFTEETQRGRNIVFDRSKLIGNWKGAVVPAIAANVSRSIAQHKRLEQDATGFHTELEWLEVLVRFKNRCSRCECSGEQVALTKDHITPLSQGGTNLISNIQPLCLRCNSWKGDRDIDFRPFFLRKMAAGAA